MRVVKRTGIIIILVEIINLNIERDAVSYYIEQWSVSGNTACFTQVIIGFTVEETFSAMRLTVTPE